MEEKEDEFGNNIIMYIINAIYSNDFYDSGSFKILEKNNYKLEKDKALLQVKLLEVEDEMTTLRKLLDAKKQEVNNNETYKRKLETLESEYNSILLKYKNLLKNTAYGKIK